MKYWNTLPYARRNAYLLLLGLLFALLVWRLSLSATYTLYAQNKELQHQLEQAQNAPATIQKMKQQAANWEQAALSFTATQHDAQKQLFARVSETCGQHKVKLRELSHAGSAQESGTQLETFRVQLEGGFQELVKATHQLEEKLQGGRLVSVQFQKVHDRRNQRVFLQGTLYIQSIMKETYEKE